MPIHKYILALKAMMFAGYIILYLVGMRPKYGEFQHSHNEQFSLHQSIPHSPVVFVQFNRLSVLVEGPVGNIDDVSHLQRFVMSFPCQKQA
jgi:hypothetical protein